MSLVVKRYVLNLKEKQLIGLVYTLCGIYAYDRRETTLGGDKEG